MSDVYGRSRNWCWLVYPESAPSDWYERLLDLGVPCIVSPCHDKDVDDDGCVKKAHYHIIVMYSSKKSRSQVEEDLAFLNAPGGQPSRDIRSSVRYLIHLDHPHKFQYLADDIRSICGASHSDYLTMSKSEQAFVLKDILAFCKENHICEYCDFVDYCTETENMDWFRAATEVYTMALSAYFRSVRGKYGSQ